MPPNLIQFAHFELDCARYELRKNGRALRIEKTPMELLLLLVKANGHLVTRKQIQDHLWGNDVFVDTEHGINTAVRKIRQVLDDDPENPRFVQTVQRKGYRFIATITGASETGPPNVDTAKPAQPDLHSHEIESQAVPVSVRDTAAVEARIQPAGKKTTSFWLVAVGMLVVVVGIALSVWWIRSRNNLAPTPKDTVVLADFTNTTGDPVFDDTLKTALAVSLRQSPFLSILSDDNVAATLRLMSRTASTVLTAEAAREVCQRVRSKAFIAGSIAELGSQYVLGLKAVNCQSGETLAQEQVTAPAKEKVLAALDKAAAQLRGELGESLATVRKFDVPLAEATTPSLEALKAYSVGEKLHREKGVSAALPYHQRAIELDPGFAIGYEGVGSDYYVLNQAERASAYFAKAFELRAHVSERERLAITADYYSVATGEQDKAAETYHEAIRMYPEDYRLHLDLGLVYNLQGQHEQAREAYSQSLRLAPDNAGATSNLVNTLLALQRFDEVGQILRQTEMGNTDVFILHSARYALDFLRKDPSAMEAQREWFAGKPEENFGLSLASDTEAYSGRLHKARELTKQSVDSAVQADNKEAGAIWQEIAAQREAAFGYAIKAKRAATDGLKLAPSSPGAAAEAALAFAMTRDTARAESLAQDINKRFPLDMQMQSLWLPTIRAQLALDENDPARALNELQAAARSELGIVPFVANLSCLYPTYVRGEAFLAEGQGGTAAAEFQEILDHSGMVWNCWTGALARLGLARANAMQAKTSHGADAEAARARAVAAYKDLLTLWKDADSSIPILKQVKAEYAKLQ